MNRAALAGFAALTLAPACTEMGRSLVLVEVTPDTAFTMPPRGRAVVASNAGDLIAQAEGDWTASPLKLGVYVPKNVSGPVQVVACALNGAGDLIVGHVAPAIVSVSPGKETARVSLTMTSAPPSPLCGASVGDAGTGGRGGGGGGTGGSTGGSAGGMSGTGGGTAGTGGVAGSVAGGTGGATAGAGGTTAGASAGGTGGRGGAGGTAGTGGRGGTGGTAGMGGRGGTGTAGTGGSAAGTGGSAGRGGAGGSAAGTGGTGGSAAGTGGAGGPSWGLAMGVAASGVDEKNPSVAINFKGQVVVVYEHGTDIYATCYDPTGTGWSTPANISVGVVASQRPMVVADGSGAFTAIWQGAGTTTGVWQTKSDCVSWNSAGPLTTANATRPVIAVNSDGAAVAAWSELPSGGYPQVVITTRDTVNNWSLVNTVVKTGDDASDRSPIVGFPDIGGQVFVVWEQTSNGVGSVWWRMWSAATNSWLTNAAPLDTSDSFRAYAPAIATNHSGNVIVTYLERTLSTTQLWSRTYSPGGPANFGSALMVAEATEIDATVPPSVTLDNPGMATVAWGQLASGKYNATVGQGQINATTFVVTPLEMDDAAADDGTFGTTSFATMPIVRGNGQGTVFAVWRKRISNTRFDLFAKRFASGAWGSETKLETIDLTSSNVNVTVFNPTLDVNGSAQAAAAWYYGGPNVPVDVYANLFR